MFDAISGPLRPRKRPGVCNLNARHITQSRATTLKPFFKLNAQILSLSHRYCRQQSFGGPLIVSFIYKVNLSMTLFFFLLFIEFCIIFNRKIIPEKDEKIQPEGAIFCAI